MVIYTTVDFKILVVSEIEVNVGVKKVMKPLLNPLVLEPLNPSFITGVAHPR